MSFCASVTNLALMLSLLPAAQLGEAKKPTAPESFRAHANVASGKGQSAATYVDIKVDKYARDVDREAMLTALKTGGYPALLTALRNAPALGTVKIGETSAVIRWAREQRTGEHKRTISIVTDKPLGFVGGAKVDAKPREGYELAVLQLEMDDAGTGMGTMAAAAKIKPGGPNGIQLDDYADAPIKFVSITRAM